MKKIVYIIAGVAIVFASSCKKYLDVNDNPNEVLASSPDLVLPQAIVTSAAVTHSSYNVGIGQDLMYNANAGGFSGFGTVVSYDYLPATFTGAWANTYDNLTDYQYVLKNTAGIERYKYFNAVARIMSSYMWAMLVDQYEDIPYSEALKGVDNITPKYDKGTEIYPKLAAQIDTAIMLINEGLANPTATTNLTRTNDPLFAQSGTTSMLAWKQFANTVKLRMIVRATASGKVAFKNSTFTSDGFITTDALVNPGYSTAAAAKQSPIWLYTIANALIASSSRIPSTFSAAFYNGTKLSDPKRMAVVYKVVPATSATPATNQLGNESSPNPPSSPSPNAYFKGTSAAGGYDKAGIYKGPDASVPLITAAESYFLQAEAVARGYITGNAQTLFNSGIVASYQYLYKDNTGGYTSSYAVTTTPLVTYPLTQANAIADAAAYQAANPTSYLVNYNLATTLDQRVEAIITQKYIALNQISSHESWNDYRRTGYPVSTGTAPATSLASTQSLATRPDRLPTRFPYPSTEVNANAANIPAGVNKFSTLLFYAK